MSEEKQKQKKEIEEIKTQIARSSKTEERKELFLVVLDKNLGIISKTCRMTGIAKSVFYHWYHADPEFAQKVDEVEEVALDFAESSLHTQISKGNTSATIFYLKTKGRKRGYIESVNIRHGIDREANAEMDDIIDGMSPAQKARILGVPPMQLVSGDKKESNESGE